MYCLDNELLYSYEIDISGSVYYNNVHITGN